MHFLTIFAIKANIELLFFAINPFCKKKGKKTGLSLLFKKTIDILIHVLKAGQSDER